jgi:hypothetical protein
MGQTSPSTESAGIRTEVQHARFCAKPKHDHLEKGGQRVEGFSARIFGQAVEEFPAQVGDEVDRFRGHRATRRDRRS